MERLQKFIASCGITSRRKAEELITSGKVIVNGEIIKLLGVKIDPEKDIVSVNGKKIDKEINKIYIKLYKPEGYITSTKDQFNRKCVIDLINIKQRIYPIGRLDYDTSGLLLLTNDGELSNKLLHPKYHIYKTYLAKIQGNIKDDSIDKLKAGVLIKDIEDFITSPSKIKIVKRTSTFSIIEISIYEGRNRQVRKMFDAVGHKVYKLKRISFGNIVLGSLEIGEWNYLNNDEIDFLKNQEV